MDEGLKTYLDEMKRELREHVTTECEKVETKLLTAFHNWAGPGDQKLRSHREAIRALDLEIEAIGARVSKLEAAQEPIH